MNAQLYHLLIVLWALAVVAPLVFADYDISDFPGEYSDDGSSGVEEEEFGYVDGDEYDGGEEPAEEFGDNFDFDDNPLEEEMAEDAEGYF